MSETYECDVVVIGSGAAGLIAALTARAQGAEVLVVEKSEWLGGTTAMSGGNVWVPCHHHQTQIGASDSRDEALAYIRAASPPGWHNTEEPLWVSFVDHAPMMLWFLEAHTPLRFVPNREPDPYAELPGGKAFGRNISASPLTVRILGPWADKLRASVSVLCFLLCYEEVVDTNFYANPRRWMIRLAPRLLWRMLTRQRTMGGALVVGLLKGCLDQGCVIWNASSAEGLNKSDWRVVGVEVKRDGKQVRVVARKMERQPRHPDR